MDNSIQAHQKELCNKLWAMANALRGNMEAYEFKNYILGMYFLRLCPALSLEYFSDCIIKPFPALSIIIGALDFGSVRFTRDAISPNGVVLYDSSKPGNRSFGRFSRPLLEEYTALIIPPTDNVRGGGQYD